MVLWSELQTKNKRPEATKRLETKVKKIKHQKRYLRRDQQARRLLNSHHQVTDIAEDLQDARLAELKKYFLLFCYFLSVD